VYIYVVYLVGGANQVIFAGAWESREEAQAWCGERTDLIIAQVPIVRKK
jgi:hypothetical protein